MTKDEVKQFYTQARYNHSRWIETSRGYEKERSIAFVDYCDWVLDELDSFPEPFDSVAFRKHTGYFEYPPEAE